MNRSIALRLAAMFAVAALVVFALVGFALHRVLENALDRHQLEQLNTKFQMMKYTIVRTRTPDRWEKVTAKLDTLSPADGNTEFWVWSADPRFQYGKSLPEVAAAMAGKTGIGEMMIADRPYPMKTEVEEIPAEGQMPAVRFMVGVDSAPFFTPDTPS